MSSAVKSDSSNSISATTISFDGDNVLCQVCGDKSSGFHYGVHACEGCKGFFRRSIQQKLQYRPCTKNQQCSILRINRNRCQYCRLKKCIAVGMSRDAVRYGRVPKREKAKLLAEKQKANAHCHLTALTVEMDDGRRTIEAIVSAHFETCDFTKAKAEDFLGLNVERHLSRVACPLNPKLPDVDNTEELAERYSPAIRGVVNFAKSIPGFHILCQEDQITLLKAGVFEVLLLRLSRLFDLDKERVVLLDGSVYRRDLCRTLNHSNGFSNGQGHFLVDSLFDFAERFNALRLTDADIALFCAYVLISPDRPGLRNPEVVEVMNLRLKQLLLDVLQNNHSNQSHHCSGKRLIETLISKVQDLRTLNTLHSEKLLAFKMESHQQQNKGTIRRGSSLCSTELSVRTKSSSNETNGAIILNGVVSESPKRKKDTPSSDSGKGASPATSCDSCDSCGGGGSSRKRRAAFSAEMHPQVADSLPHLKRALLAPPCDLVEDSAAVVCDLRRRHVALTALLERPVEYSNRAFSDSATVAATAALRQWWLNGSSIIVPQCFYWNTTLSPNNTSNETLRATTVIYDQDQPLNLSKKITPVKC